jgi:hypothetical protein
MNFLKRPEEGAAIQVSGEKCKLCDFVLERISSRGEVKTVTTLKLEEKNHYLVAHFRDTLIQKYPGSFAGPLPLRCAKCEFVIRIKNADLNTQVKLMLSHVAACNRELDAMIAGIGDDGTVSMVSAEMIPKAKPVDSLGKDRQQCEAPVRKSRAAHKPTPTSVPTTLKAYLSQDHCQLCGTKKNFANDVEKKFHCVDHFYESLCSIFQDLIKTVPNQGIVCPRCKTMFDRQKTDVDRGELRRFFVHLCFVHNYMERLFFPGTLNKFPISLLNIKEGNFESLLADKFWAIREGSCLICPATNIASRNERVQHYAAHFVQLRHVFGTAWKEKKVCFICGCAVLSQESYRWHLYERHFQQEMKASIRYKRNGMFQCSYCKEEHARPHDLAEHLVNGELLLEVVCLRYIRRRGLRLSQIYDAYEGEKQVGCHMEMM